MSDSMTKDDVLSALGEISQHFENCTEATYGGSHERFHRWMNAADWAAAYLNDPAPTIGGWISVKDRLPGDEFVLASVVTKNTGHRWETPTIGEIAHGKWYLETFGMNADNVGVTVTHWQPLPEPPKGVSGDA